MPQDEEKRGLLDWLRDAHHGAEADSVEAGRAAAELTMATRLQQDVTRRHVDRGEIARGGMGSIRRVFDRNLQRTVAMKVLFEESLADPKASQHFVEEAQIMGQLEHPNIVPVHDLGEDHHGTRYFTMLYVRGKTLTDILSSETVEIGSHEAYFRLLQIFLKVCDAVSFAHSRGVIHRDLKPDNIMVGAFGEVYLMDWGIAKLLGRGSPAPAILGSTEGDSVNDPAEPVRVMRDEALADDEQGQIIGTFFYMSPEQALAKVDDIDERTDIFLLGGVLYEILTGQPPFMGKTVVDVVRASQACKVPEPDSVAPERNIPAALSRICMKCLKKDPADRYQHVAELQAEVETFLRGGATFPTLTFKAGEHLMREGDKGDQVFILKSGTVQVYKTYGDGRRQGLATLGPGAVVGEAAVLSSGARTASVVAVDEVRATAVTRTQLEKELGAHSWMASLVRALADRFIEVDDNLDAARARLHDAELERLLWQTLAERAQPTETGARAMPLSALLLSCRKALKRTEYEVARVLEGMAGLKIDAERDVVSYQPRQQA
jgi:eukaryotic-like serine/threonine-protein kinase